MSSTSKHQLIVLVCLSLFGDNSKLRTRLECVIRGVAVEGSVRMESILCVRTRRICDYVICMSINRLAVLSRVLRDSTLRYVGPSVGRSVGWLIGRLVPFWAAAPKGSMTYAFTHMGNFLLLLLLLLLRPPPLKSQSQGPNSSLEDQIPVLRAKSLL